MSIKVSILLPNLNNRPYLERRIQSILDQTLDEWELIVMDGYSQDGAWEFFQACAAAEPRIRIYQSAEKGIYNNINRCLELAVGDNIYIATSDDTMTRETLEKMTKALEENPECDIAHCKLKIIDEEGNLSPEKTWDNFFIIRYFGEYIDKKHIRRAPHDGLLHYCGITVYTSLTQLLIRRRLFDRIGPFLVDYGSIADYEWDMRASLVADTVHIPEYLATWRVHRDQATTDDRIIRAKAQGKFLELSDNALRIAVKLKPDLKKTYRIPKFRGHLEKEYFFLEMKTHTHFLKRLAICLKWLILRPRFAFVWINLFRRGRKDCLSQEEILHHFKTLMAQQGLDKNLISIES